MVGRTDYLLVPRITQSVAMGVGTAGAMTDVSAYANLKDGVTRSTGRSSEFDDTPPGTFSLAFDNPTGNFTPGNTGSAFATRLTQNMSVCWDLGGRLTEGTIRAIEPMFPGSIAAWSQVKITCDDMLGDAGRTEVDNIPDAILAVAEPLLVWPLDDAAGSGKAVEASGGMRLLPYTAAGFDATAAIFGASAFPGLPGTATLLSLPEGGAVRGLATTAVDSSFVAGAPRAVSTAFPYADDTAGFWGVWVEPYNYLTPSVKLTVQHAILDMPFYIQYQPNIPRIAVFAGSVSATYNLSAAENSAPLYMAMGISVTYNSGGAYWLATATLYVNGVAQATAVYDDTTMASGHIPAYSTANRQPTYVGLEISGVAAASPTLVRVARLSHTMTLVREESCCTLTEAGQLQAIALTTPALTLDTLPAGLSTAPVLPLDGSGTALTKFNDVIRTEQGHIYTETTGTLLAPVQKVVVRDRDRPETVSYSFDVERECVGAPQFVFDITDMASTVTASGPTRDVSFTDASLTDRVGSANVTEQVVLTGFSDMLEWAQDRSQRGANVQLKMVTVTVDAMTTPTNRSADLLAMVQGDRLQFTNCPTTQLGFTTWDGGLLGVDELHSEDQHLFEMHFQPVLPRTAIFDTDRFMADGALTLSAAIATAGATSMSVATTGPKLSTTAVPYTMLIASEQVTLTACTGATPQVATITRGVNGTTATTHASGATLEMATPALFKF